MSKKSYFLDKNANKIVKLVVKKIFVHCVRFLKMGKNELSQKVDDFHKKVTKMRQLCCLGVLVHLVRSPAPVKAQDTSMKDICHMFRNMSAKKELFVGVVTAILALENLLVSLNLLRLDP
jgi:hypothetical protein